MVKLENIPWIQDLIRTRPVLIDELNADKRELLGPDSLQRTFRTPEKGILGNFFNSSMV